LPGHKSPHRARMGRKEGRAMAELYIGIDVAKTHLDVAVRPTVKSEYFCNFLQVD